MFGTLVVQLPSVFSGGEFVVRHGRVEKTYALGSDDSSCSQLSHFVAHYADCEHAVREVTGGHRLALVYSLCWKGEGAPPTAAILSSTKLSERLANMLEEGFHANDVPTPLCVYLEHKYTEASLSQLGVRALKGRDRATAEALLAAGDVLAEKEKDRGNELSMCIASCSQVREEDCSYNGTSYSGAYAYERDTKLKVVFEADGKINKELQRLKVDWTSWIQSESFILSDSDSDYEEKRRRRDDKDDSGSDKDDDRDGGDYAYSAWRSMHDRHVHVTGNEGATKTTTYSSYILMVWPKKLYVNVLTECGMDCALSYVDGASETEAATLLSYVVKHVSSDILEKTAASCTLLLRALMRFRQPQLVCDLLEVIATPRRQHSQTEAYYRDDDAASLLSLDITMAIVDAALALGLAHVQAGIEKVMAASREHHRMSQLELRLTLVEKLALDIHHKKSVVEDSLAHFEARGSISKDGIRLLVSVNDTDLLARFQKTALACFQGKKKYLLEDDELAPQLAKIDNVLADEQVKDPARRVLDHVRKEGRQLSIRRFVEAVEQRDPEKSEYRWGYYRSVVRDEELSILFQRADASMLSRFQTAVQRWNLDERRMLNSQIDKCVKETRVPPEALSAVRKIKTALISFLRKETRRKPEYTNKMSEARYPHDASIEKFLRGPRLTKKIDADGDREDARELRREIKCDCEDGSGFSVKVLVGGTDDHAYVVLKKTRDVHNKKVQKYEEKRRMLEELLKERDGTVVTTKDTSRSTSSSPEESESAEPASKQAKLDD